MTAVNPPRLLRGLRSRAHCWRRRIRARRARGGSFPRRPDVASAVWRSLGNRVGLVLQGWRRHVSTNVERQSGTRAVPCIRALRTREPWGVGPPASGFTERVGISNLPSARWSVLGVIVPYWPSAYCLADCVTAVSLMVMLSSPSLVRSKIGRRSPRGIVLVAPLPSGDSRYLGALAGVAIGRRASLGSVDCIHGTGCSSGSTTTSGSFFLDQFEFTKLRRKYPISGRRYNVALRNAGIERRARDREVRTAPRLGPPGLGL